MSAEPGSSMVLLLLPVQALTAVLEAQQTVVVERVDVVDEDETKNSLSDLTWRNERL